MAFKKEDWIEGKEAAALLSKLSGHQVNLDYVRRLAHNKLIRFRKKDGRTNEYFRPDIEGYRVRKINVNRQSRKIKGDTDFKVPA